MFCKASIRVLFSEVRFFETSSDKLDSDRTAQEIRDLKSSSFSLFDDGGGGDDDDDKDMRFLLL